MNRTYPKNAFKTEVLRTNWSKEGTSKGVKTGGLAAIVRIPDELNEANWGEVQVYQPDNEEDHPGWFDHVKTGMELRVCIRGTAQRKNELFGKALPLKNQPTMTQAEIKAKLQFDKVEQTEGDKLEEQLKIDIKQKQERSIQLAQAKRLQRLALMGEWLEGNEKALTMAQGIICSAFFEWCDDHSEDADSKCLHEMMDAIHYIIELGGKLRSNCWCPDKDYDGVLYYNDSNGKPIKVIDLNELS